MLITEMLAIFHQKNASSLNVIVESLNAPIPQMQIRKQKNAQILLAQIDLPLTIKRVIIEKLDMQIRIEDMVNAFIKSVPVVYISLLFRQSR